jgi:hypothetical protein
MLSIIASLVIKSILSTIMWQWKIFDHYMTNNEKNSIATTWATENFQSLSLWRPNLFLLLQVL